jgi:protein-tyrosine phosphatase
MDDPSNLDLYQQAELPHKWLPTTGGKAPTPGHIEEFVQFVHNQHEQSHSVVVHCSSGRRRTGTFLAAYLIQAGHSVEQALDAIEQSNPLVELREDQLHFLESLGQ